MKLVNETPSKTEKRKSLKLDVSKLRDLSTAEIDGAKGGFDASPYETLF